jgi:hypothetical protein
MPSSEMLRHEDLVRSEISEERQTLQEPHGVTSQKTAFFWQYVIKFHDDYRRFLDLKLNLFYSFLPAVRDCSSQVPVTYMH